MEWFGVNIFELLYSPFKLVQNSNSTQELPSIHFPCYCGLKTMGLSILCTVPLALLFLPLHFPNRNLFKFLRTYLLLGPWHP
jgi:hypothetical protein